MTLESTMGGKVDESYVCLMLSRPSFLYILLEGTGYTNIHGH